MANLYPIGTITPLLGTFNGLGIYSDASVTLNLPNWLQLCDGSIVNDVDSPFDGLYLPNLVGITLYGWATGQQGVFYSSFVDAIITSGFNAPIQALDFIADTSLITTKYYMRIK
jgi:hypothetical protein